ncbi:MAG: hypothetical protein D3923_04805 [Candidatus Electrothrix sp. AR3]|nr:hypothetical protein [Candidatus Electrothrix sp. AR3]
MFNEIWERIKSETELHKLKDLAREVGTIPQSISRKKKEDNFPLQWILKIADKYNLSTDWILTGKGPKKRYETAEDDYILMLEKWLKEYTEPDPRKRIFFEVKLEETFPDFKDWIKKRSDSEC